MTLERSPTATSAQVSSGIGAARVGPLLVASALLGALLWSYWPTIAGLMKDWRLDDNYSVGQLVPFAALYLLWQERAALAKCVVNPCWWGVALLLLAQMARAYGLVQFYESGERYSMVVTVWGVVLLVGGWQIFWRVRWILLFLFLMVPLPGVIHNAITRPLQDFATVSAVFSLELVGVDVVRQGNIMVLNGDMKIAVAEACSGLRMLTAFVVVAWVFAYIVNRPRWQKITLVLSSFPVALLCNLIRLVVTAILFLIASSELAERFFHDFAGWTMMPLAIFMLVGELWVLSRLVIEDRDEPKPSCL